MKKLIVIGPATAQTEDLKIIKRSLDFLSASYEITVLDPLEVPGNDYSNPRLFFDYWVKEIEIKFSQAHVFFGFSLGGVILTQCFPLFATEKKPLFLFSTPSYADDELKKKLQQVISLCQENSIDEAIFLLQSYLGGKPKTLPLIKEKIKASKRLALGLSMVMDTDCREPIQHQPVFYTHFIGKESNLVTSAQIVKGPKGQIIQVPHAGMRVLEDNPEYCQRHILRRL